MSQPCVRVRGKKSIVRRKNLFGRLELINLYEVATRTKKDLKRIEGFGFFQLCLCEERIGERRTAE
jgi:hypothetical protein